MFQNALHVLLVEHVIDHAGAAFELPFYCELRAILWRRIQPALTCPVRERLAIEIVLPANTGELHTSDVAAASIVHDVEDGFFLDAVPKNRVLDASLERGVSATERPTRNQDIQPRR